MVVSDGTHLFRIHAICAADGLDVLTSPRPRVVVEGGSSDAESDRHEILSYTAWRLHSSEQTRTAADSAVQRRPADERITNKHKRKACGTRGRQKIDGIVVEPAARSSVAPSRLSKKQSEDAARPADAQTSASPPRRAAFRRGQQRPRQRSGQGAAEADGAIRARFCYRRVVIMRGCPFEHLAQFRGNRVGRGLAQSRKPHGEDSRRAEIESREPACDRSASVCAKSDETSAATPRLAATCEAARPRAALGRAQCSFASAPEPRGD